MAKAVNDESIQYFKPEVSCFLQYWGYHHLKENAPSSNTQAQPLDLYKTKIVKVHPLYSLLLACDENERISLWNYEIGRLIWEQPVYSIVNDGLGPEKRVTVIPHRTRYNARSVARMNDDFSTQRVKVDFSYKKPVDPTTKYKETFGKVKDLDFADYGALSYNGSEYADGTSENRIVVLFEHAVIVIDMLTKKVFREASGVAQKAPNAVDFLTPQLCLIGCADGNIRILNMRSAKVEKVFVACTKEILLMKVIPCER
jgi:WD40 repeat protein